MDRARDRKMIESGFSRSYHKTASRSRRRQRDIASSLARITPSLLMVMLASIPLLFGAVQPGVWSSYAAAAAALFLFEMWRDGIDVGFIQGRWFLLSLGIFFVFTLLQAVPLPLWLLTFLAPASQQVFTQSSTLLETDIAYHAVAYVPRASLAWWFFLLGLLLFYCLLRQYLVGTRQLRIVVAVMMGVALLEGLYGLLQALVPSLGVLWVDSARSYVGDARGTFINRNHFAGFVEMVWPLGLGVILSLSQRWRENAWAGKYRKRLKVYLSSDQIGFLLFFSIALLFILLALLFSKSRAGVISAFVGLISFLLLVHLGGKKFSTAAWVFTGLGVAFLLFYGNVIGFKVLIGRFLATDDNVGSRLNIWLNTLAIIKDHPLGIGLRNFATVFPVYNSPGLPGIKYIHAHNDYLQLLAEAGWPGFIAMAGGFFAFLGRCVWRVRKAGRRLDPARFYIGIGAISGLISIAFHSFFDFNLQIPANLLYFVVLLAIGGFCFRRDRSRMGGGSD